MRCASFFSCKLCCPCDDKTKSIDSKDGSDNDQMNISRASKSHSLELLQYLEESSDDEESDSEPVEGCRKRTVTIDVNRDLTARHFRREMNRELPEPNETKLKDL